MVGNPCSIPKLERARKDNDTLPLHPLLVRIFTHQTASSSSSTVTKNSYKDGFYQLSPCTSTYHTHPAHAQDLFVRQKTLSSFPARRLSTKLSSAFFRPSNSRDLLCCTLKKEKKRKESSYTTLSHQRSSQDVPESCRLSTASAVSAIRPTGVSERVRLLSSSTISSLLFSI